MTDTSVHSLHQGHTHCSRKCILFPNVLGFPSPVNGPNYIPYFPKLCPSLSRDLTSGYTRLILSWPAKDPWILSQRYRVNQTQAEQRVIISLLSIIYFLLWTWQTGAGRLKSVLCYQQKLSLKILLLEIYNDNNILEQRVSFTSSRTGKENDKNKPAKRKKISIYRVYRFGPWCLKNKPLAKSGTGFRSRWRFYSVMKWYGQNKNIFFTFKTGTSRPATIELNSRCQWFRAESPASP